MWKLHARAGCRALSLSLPPGGSQGPGWARGARSDRAAWQPGPPHSLVVHCRVQRAPNAPQLDRSKHQHPSPRPSGRPADPPGRSRALLAHCIDEDGPPCLGGACWLTDSPLLPATPAAEPSNELSFPAGGEASPSTFPASDSRSSHSILHVLARLPGAEQTRQRGWACTAGAPQGSFAGKSQRPSGELVKAGLASRAHRSS